MPTVTTIQNGKTKIIRAKKDALLSFVLGDGGVHIDMPCGGKGTCRKCLVKISGQYCLACQTKIDSDIEVEIQNDNAFGQILDGGEITRKGECPMYTKYSLAIDIGTTTICASIIGLDGAYEAEVLKNPQTVFGADVISRIERALGGGLPELAEAVQTALNGMISRLANRQRISPEEIDAAVITGNTAMLYLLSGLNPETLSHAPFEADHLFGEYVPAELLGFGISKFANIYLPRCISAFVGADITTAILASGMCEDVTTSLLADIGTNGELALWHNGVLHCASTAAGPAFEGGGLSCGVYGVTGAIDKVWLDDGKICSSTIGGVPAVGICGSGIVDALAMMLELGIIDETGAFENGEALELQDGVQVTSQDVRKIQLAKGSIRAGIETLLETSGLNKSEIGTLYISGGFGNYLDLNSAAAIGLIPPELLPVTKCIGNAAHIGAAMLLQDKSLIEKAIESAKSAKTVPLDANPVFTDNYMRHMMFGQG